MRFVEENEATWSAEQLAAAEAQIEQQKREWELGRLQAMKAEEERRMQEEELDEDLLTYSREDATNQVNDFKIKKKPTRKKAQFSESESDETSDTTTDSLTEEEEEDDEEEEEDDNSNGDLDDVDDSDYESKRKARRNSVRNEKSNVSENFNNSSRKTRSRGSVDINLWTLDENPILPGVKPVVRNTSSKDGHSTRKTVVKLVKINGETYDHCKSKSSSCRNSNKAKRKRQYSSRESSDVDIISCSNDSNDSFGYVKAKSKGSRRIVDCNESNGPVSPRQLTVKN